VMAYAQNQTQNACSCYCGAPSDDGPVWGIYGAYPIDNCNQCTSDDTAVNCPKYFPDQCPEGSSYFGECGVADPNDDWAGDWVIDPCSACLLDAENKPIGDCIPCCDASNCDCIYGTITITDLGVATLGGAEVTQIQFQATGTSSGQTTSVGNETGTLGTTATVLKAVDTYDLVKHGDALQLRSHAGVGCYVNATRNPPTTSMLALALLLGGVGIVVLGCIVFCCCNPCKKKDKKDQTLLGEGQEGQTEGQAPEVGTINYTGGKPTPSDV